MAGVLAALGLVVLTVVLCAYLRRREKRLTERIEDAIARSTAETAFELGEVRVALRDHIDTVAAATADRLDRQDTDTASLADAVRSLAGVVSQRSDRLHEAITARPLPPERPELDDDDIKMLREKDAAGHLAHPLCVWCGGWHVPPLPAAGCPRVRSAEIDKHQAVTHVEFWPEWDTSHTVFPWELPDEEPTS